jgi:hypothetical protein
VPDADGRLSDNYFDLLPRRRKVVVFTPKKIWDKQMRLKHYHMVSR